MRHIYNQWDLNLLNIPLVFNLRNHRIANANRLTL